METIYTIDLRKCSKEDRDFAKECSKYGLLQIGTPAKVDLTECAVSNALHRHPIVEKFIIEAIRQGWKYWFNDKKEPKFAKEIPSTEGGWHVPNEFLYDF